ncbi:MAG: hypothetical protein K2X39_09740, partial [Silvanigrellaceae bacterium]|nr:hypothetical protein [Silvanigrellaceae bacterium]
FLQHWKLTNQEYQLLEHIQNLCAKKILSHARHEQEVHQAPCKNTFGVASAGKSAGCQYDAFVHLEHPIFTFQSHPETYHEKQDGHLLIKNFIYFSSLLLSTHTLP